MLGFHPSMRHLSLLVDLSAMASREVELDALLDAACERLAPALDADRASLWLIDAEQGKLVTRVATLPELPSIAIELGRGIAGYVARTGETVRVDDAGADPRFDSSVDARTGYVTRSMLVAPVRATSGTAPCGVVQVLNKRGGAFDEHDATYLAELAIELGELISYTSLRAVEGAGPGLVLRGRFNHVVGRSPAMLPVYERLARAAATDATVLLRGETGTGKTLLARTIHANSGRQGGAFVTVDCASLPGQLVETELFGHERGAFTGADRTVKGKVELAEGGTLFLDEIGELSPEVQRKLLRFLQDRAFERVGGRETRTVDVRVIAATHVDLEREVTRGAFREDLYYRVRVVEIEVPPLRERGVEEIMRLASHFAAEYGRRYGKPRAAIGRELADRLSSHSFPGNVRELEHWIESAVVLSLGDTLSAEDLPRRSEADPAPRGATPRGVTPDPESVCTLPLGLTLAEAQSRYIEATVESVGGNRTEAARRLEIGRNTVARLLKPR